MSNSDDEKQMAKACDMQGLAQEFAALLAERDALKADAERWQYFVTHCEWLRRDEVGSRYSSMSLRLPYWADQSCVAMRNHAIDAARKDQTP